LPLGGDEDLSHIKEEKTAGQEFGKYSP